MLAHFITGHLGQGSGLIYGESVMMDRECCSTSCPISSDPRQLASTLATCYSTSQIAAARLDVRAPACTWGSSGGIERDPA